MRVLVAGATGAIGRPLISALVASRREVIGITTTERGVQTLRDKGAEAFVADALDRNAIEAVIRKVRPEAVIDELTSLPKKYTHEEMRVAEERDRKLRLVGGRNVRMRLSLPAPSVTSCSPRDFSKRLGQGPPPRQNRWRRRRPLQSQAAFEPICRLRIVC